jgi:hypothetical protein
MTDPLVFARAPIHLGKNSAWEEGYGMSYSLTGSLHTSLQSMQNPSYAVNEWTQHGHPHDDFQSWEKRLRLLWNIARRVYH